MTKPASTKKYWNTNLDTDNLSRRRQKTDRLEDMIAFATTPEFEWVQKRFGNVSGKILVDLGGGIGMHALVWARAGAQVVVADLAVNRLRMLRQLARQLGLEERMQFVAARAESLPFQADSTDYFFTKSVLIHTDLPVTAAEIYRVLKTGGQGGFIEPLNRNPIIRLYRRLLAPGIWKSITRYFDARALADLRGPFGRLRWKGFYLLSAGSFFWQYGMKRLARFRKSLHFWGKLDRSLMKRMGGLEEWCWFAAIEVKKGERQ